MTQRLVHTERAMSYKISRYGWLPDLPDHRDHFYAAPVEVGGGFARQHGFARPMPAGV